MSEEGVLIFDKKERGVVRMGKKRIVWREYEVSDKLKKIYALAGKDGIWLREWPTETGWMAAAGYAKEIEALEKKFGLEIDIGKLSLGDCINLAEPGSGQTREEACRNAIKALKRSKKR